MNGDALVSEVRCPIHGTVAAYAIVPPTWPRICPVAHPDGGRCARFTELVERER